MLLIIISTVPGLRQSNLRWQSPRNLLRVHKPIHFLSTDVLPPTAIGLGRNHHVIRVGHPLYFLIHCLCQVRIDSTGPVLVGCIEDDFAAVVLHEAPVIVRCS
jgi:hypothetical protein